MDTMRYLTMSLGYFYRKEGNIAHHASQEFAKAMNNNYRLPVGSGGDEYTNLEESNALRTVVSLFNHPGMANPLFFDSVASVEIVKDGDNFLPVHYQSKHSGNFTTILSCELNPPGLSVQKNERVKFMTILSEGRGLYDAAKKDMESGQDGVQVLGCHTSSVGELIMIKELNAIIPQDIPEITEMSIVYTKYYHDLVTQNQALNDEEYSQLVAIINSYDIQRVSWVPFNVSTFPHSWEAPGYGQLASRATLHFWGPNMAEAMRGGGGLFRSENTCYAYGDVRLTEDQMTPELYASITSNPQDLDRVDLSSLGSRVLGQYEGVKSNTDYLIVALMIAELDKEPNDDVSRIIVRGIEANREALVKRYEAISQENASHRVKSMKECYDMMNNSIEALAG